MTAKTLVALLLLNYGVAQGASQYPPSYEWKTITTPHFYIHYHAGLDDLAQRTVSLAETIHDRLTPLMGWEPEQRTHVVLSDNIDASNGSATFFPNNRIELYVSAPGADPSSPLEFYDNWINLVLTHEYTHILHLDQAFAVSSVLRRIFGRNPISFPNAYSPLWMTEGIATLIESEATGAGRLKGTYVDMILRTSAIEHTWFSEVQASGFTGRWPGGSARYFYGSKFLEYVAKTEGFDRLAAFFHEYASTPIPYRVDATAVDVFGMPMTEMYRQWSQVAQREYLKHYRELSRQGLTEKESLSNLGFETKYAVVSPDGHFLAYAHRGPFESPTLRVFDLKQGRDVKTKRVNTISHLSWSADGTQIAYSQLEFKNSFELLSDLYVWNLEAGGADQITSGKRLKDPAFTPDGRSLIAVMNRGGRNHLVEVDLAGRSIRTVVEPPGFEQFSEPVVSPDGNTIAVGEWREGRIDVVLYDRAGNRLRNLTETLPPSTSASPRFSRDGQTVVFSSDASDISNIYAVDIAGSNLRRISNHAGGGFFPSTTDGEDIYYIDYSGRGFDLARFKPKQLYETGSRVIPETLVRRNTGIDAVDILDYEQPSRRPAKNSNQVSGPSAYTPWESLKPKWWFPILGSSNLETVIGAMTSGADVLGHHQYQAQALASFGNQQTEYQYELVYAYDRLYPTLTAGIVQFDDNVEEVVVEGPNANYVYRETNRRLVGLATVPYQRWWWRGFATLGLIRDDYEEHLPFNVPDQTLDEFGLFTGTLQGVRAGVAYDNTRQFGYSISPENGVLASLDFEELSESLGSDRNRRQFTADLRGFLSVPVRRSPLGRHVIGLRAAAGFSEGDFLLQREFKAGGADFGSLLRLDSIRWPVRGFPSGRLRGQNVAIGSVEYRLPIYQIEKGPTSYPVFFHRILGDVFYDLGTAWNNEAVNLPGFQRPISEPFDEDRTIASTGAELAVDMVFGYFVPIRYRLGAAYLLQSPRPGEAGDVQFYLSAGSSF
jgi:Tol biopolymer transport system component